VIFAGTILVISLTAVAGVYSTTRVSLQRQRDVASATVIAESFLEQIMVLPKTSPLLTAGSHAGDLRRFFPDGTPTTLTTAPFSLVWTVTDDRPVFGLKEVRVDVTWEHDGPHRITFATFRE
jgi:hypothetical protein